MYNNNKYIGKAMQVNFATNLAMWELSYLQGKVIRKRCAFWFSITNVEIIRFPNFKFCFFFLFFTCGMKKIRATSDSVCIHAAIIIIRESESFPFFLFYFIFLGFLYSTFVVVSDVVAYRSYWFIHFSRSLSPWPPVPLFCILHHQFA
jgi:hypothetical protein